MRLQGAMLYVKDLPRMRAFYRALLGVEPAGDDTWVEFDTGGETFALHAIPAAIAAGIEIGTPPRPRESVPVKLTFGVRDIETERARLDALGVTTIQRPWGAWDGVDPEGNIFALRPIVARDAGPDLTLL